MSLRFHVPIQENAFVQAILSKRRVRITCHAREMRTELPHRGNENRIAAEGIIYEIS